MDRGEISMAGAVREACLRGAAEAYEDAGLRGLCVEGRWNCAMDALRRLDLGAVLLETPHRDNRGEVAHPTGP